MHSLYKIFLKKKHKISGSPTTNSLTIGRNHPIITADSKLPRRRTDVVRRRGPGPDNKIHDSSLDDPVSFHVHLTFFLQILFTILLFCLICRMSRAIFILVVLELARLFWIKLQKARLILGDFNLFNIFSQFKVNLQISIKYYRLLGYKTNPNIEKVRISVDPENLLL
jgi:hypothetical protein